VYNLFLSVRCAVLVVMLEIINNVRIYLDIILRGKNERHYIPLYQNINLIVEKTFSVIVLFQRQYYTINLPPVLMKTTVYVCTTA
jgi:hypothetical protein